MTYRSGNVVERKAAEAGVTITVEYPDGRKATGTFEEARTFDASIPNIGLVNSRLHAYVLHLLDGAS